MTLPPIHLVVIHHGLWGNSTHMAHIDKLLTLNFPRAVETLNFNGNSFTRTYDGVDVCAVRLMAAIQARLADTSRPPVDRISFIGYSLGGLVVRYAVGILEARHMLYPSPAPSPSQPCLLRAVNLITVATPHAGAAWKADNVWGRLYNGATSWAVSASGTHITLTDRDGEFGPTKGAKRPLLDAMADPNLPFWKGLQKFNVRTTYANTINDRVVGYTTSALETSNHYRNPATRFVVDPQYPSIVRMEMNDRVVADTTPADAPAASATDADLLDDELDDESMMPTNTNDEVAVMAKAEAEQAAADETPAASKISEPTPLETAALGVTTVAAISASTALTSPFAPRKLLLYVLAPILAPIIIIAFLSLYIAAKIRNATEKHHVAGPLADARAHVAAHVAQEKAHPQPRLHTLAETRKRIIANLNILPWRKIHVRIESRRSHAAIVARPDFPHNSDVMAHLVNDFQN
ncbi:hypothetical protein PhCBS80983_g05216 [Powellomyces hirtus]|uniref:DUF676 domain-containing protein n=1 Tax=Powellomyces hirtus TaxID=109895 RepID=A0A507DUY8_9FUNG|nr:hypothetical protein PhCBS80983_g05216 [Powellomyces hirtus]